MNSLNLRRIGPSDYDALFCPNSYSSPHALYRRIRFGEEVERPEYVQLAARRGQRLQRPVFLEWAEETGQSIEGYIEDLSREPEAREWQRYTPDYVIPVSVLTEIKVVSGHRFAADGYGEDGTDHVPDRNTYQVIGQIEAMRADAPFWEKRGVDPFKIEHANIAVLEVGYRELNLHRYRVNYDPELAGLLVEGVERFWHDHILADVPPPPDATEACEAAIRSRYPIQKKVYRSATPEEEALAVQLQRASEELKSAELRAQSAKNLLMESIGDAEGIRGDFGSICWKATKPVESIDWQSMAMHLASQHGIAIDDVKSPFVRRRPGARRFLPRWKEVE